MSSVHAGATVLVTGADGFIGSHLTETLVREGFKVRALYIITPLIHGAGWINALMM